MNNHFCRTLLERASQPYLSAGRFAWHFSKGKLRGDPLFFSLLEQGIIPDTLRLIDLGCGKGLLVSLLSAARLMHEAGDWPQHWPPAPKFQNIWGLDLKSTDVSVARAAVGDYADFEVGDIRTADFGHAEAVIILDVLHYINYQEQEDVISRVRAALPAGGTLVMRIGDAAGGMSFLYSQWVDRGVMFLRGYFRARLHCRTLVNWVDLLKQHGFNVTHLPMSKGTLFCNVTLIAKVA